MRQGDRSKKPGRPARLRAALLERIPLSGWVLVLLAATFVVLAPLGLWLEQRGSLASRPLTTNLLSGAIGASFGLPFIAFAIQRSQRRAVLDKWVTVHVAVAEALSTAASTIAVDCMYRVRGAIAPFTPGIAWDTAPARILGDGDGLRRWIVKVLTCELAAAPAQPLTAEEAAMVDTSVDEAITSIGSALELFSGSPLFIDLAPALHQARRSLSVVRTFTMPDGQHMLSEREVAAMVTALAQVMAAFDAVAAVHT